MASSSDLSGACIGKYKILAHIATGGMGAVYKALDENLGRVVALKVLSAELVGNAIVLERFRREARHAARLNHKNIVTLYECGQVGETYYLALEYVEGIDLHDFINKKGQLSPTDARRIVIQAAKALDHAFQRGIVHRDIKPSNFLLARQSDRVVVKLTDLGLARTVNEDEFRVTRSGTTVGTVDYLSPEQARDSNAADIRSDIYSLGCTLYHMLAGKPPFGEGGLGERIYRHMAVEPVDVREFNPDVPARLWSVLQRMLAKDPADRFQTPTELLYALKHLEPNPGQKPPGRPQPSSMPVRPSDTERATPSSEMPRPRPQPKKQRAPRPTIAQRKDSSTQLGISAEHLQAAALQFERAREVGATGNGEYALQLLLSCCKLDPANLLYRKELRRAGQTAVDEHLLSGWLTALSSLGTRKKLKAARRAGDHRKVLEHGEEILTRHPRDLKTHLDMAASAESLDLHDLATWLLEQASQQAPGNPEVHRSLAHLYERQQRYPEAIARWELVRKIAPNDPEAAGKINDLAATDTIARGRFHR